MSAEIRYDGDQLDEVVARDVSYVHLEQLSSSMWWLGLDLADGTHVAITVGSSSGKAEVVANVDDES